MSKKKGSYVTIDRDTWKRPSWQAVTEYGVHTWAMALFLTTAPGSNMAGIYEITIHDICRHTHLSEKEARAALANLEEVGFCKYDHARHYVWDRFALRRFLASNPSQTQIAGLQNILTRLHDSEEAPFIEPALEELDRLSPEIYAEIMADGWLRYADKN